MWQGQLWAISIRPNWNAFLNYLVRLFILLLEPLSWILIRLAFVNNKIGQVWIDSNVILRRAQVYFDLTRKLKCILYLRIFYWSFTIPYQFECYYFAVAVWTAYRLWLKDLHWNCNVVYPGKALHSLFVTSNRHIVDKVQWTVVQSRFECLT